MAEPRDIFEALFLGDEIDHAEVAASMRVAREDESLRDLFNALASADDEIGGVFAAQAGEAMFLDTLDEMLAEEADGLPDNLVQLPTQPDRVADNVVSLADRRSPKIAWAVAATALLAVGAALVMFDQPQQPEFQARSAAVEASAYEMPRLEAFCVSRSADGEVDFRGTESADLQILRCARGEELKFAVESRDPRLRHVALFGTQADGSLLWYGPSPASPTPWAIPANSELSPIGETIRLEVNHDPGTVRVVGVFTEQPMSWAELDSWAKARKGQLMDGALPVDGGVAVRLTFEVTP